MNYLPIPAWWNNIKDRTRILKYIHYNSNNKCWEWMGNHDNKGYGMVRIGPKKLYRPHRLMYEWLVGKIPLGLQLDHLCRNTKCCNPFHLEPVSNYENQIRSPFTTTGRFFRDGKPTHCPRGHEYRFDNLVTAQLREGIYACKKCAKIHKQNFLDRKRDIKK